MDLKKVYYTQVNIISLALPFIIEVNGMEPFQVEVPASLLGMDKQMKEQDKHIIQEHLFEEVKKKLGNGKFFLIPSQLEVELAAYWEAQLYHPENFPMDSDESIGGFGSFRDDS